MGVVSTFTTSVTQKIGTAYQRYLPSGPIAALPLGENTYSLVWSIPTSRASNEMFKNRDQFKNLLNMAFYAPYSEVFSNSNSDWSIQEYLNESGILSEFGAIVDSTLPIFFPLKTGITPSSISISNKSLRVILMGYIFSMFTNSSDACHSIHPHAGQGLNMGIADIFALYKIMKDSTLIGCDPGRNIFLTYFRRLVDPQVIFV